MDMQTITEDQEKKRIKAEEQKRVQEAKQKEFNDIPNQLKTDGEIEYDTILNEHSKTLLLVREMTHI